MSSREEVIMAWTERTSGEHWRVRYRRGDGTVVSEGGFTTLKAARNRAREIEVDWPARPVRATPLIAREQP
jgi:hypothetical protein